MDLQHISGYAALLVGVVWLVSLRGRFARKPEGTPPRKWDWSWDLIGILTLVVGLGQLGFDAWKVLR